MQKRNPAARPRIWRPSHRTTANLGRAAFVIEPAMIGFVGQQTRAQEQTS